MTKNTKDLFDDSYFTNRNLDDPARLTSFDLEKNFIEKHASLNSKVCDVGCSTGEFLEYINWKGNRFGMEVNDYAIKIAKERDIDFLSNINNKNNYFDVVIFRGTLQHVDKPFEYLDNSFNSLKKGGKLFILATPNIDSICYRLFRDLPALDFEKNYYLPGFRHLIISGERSGFRLIDYEFPYRNSGYDKPLTDFFKFFVSLFLVNLKLKFSFPRNMMNVCFEKR